MKRSLFLVKKEMHGGVRYSGIIVTFICLVVLFCLMGNSGATLTQASFEELVTVLISFYESPGLDELSMITDLGGSINKTYHIVPTVSALVPRDKIYLLSSDSRVKQVEEDIIVSIASQEVPWGVDRIDADLVHPTNKGAGVKVAVLDTGVDLDHPDLNIAGSVSMLLPEFPTAEDDNGHGTLVTGIIAALDNDIGVVGVAPEAELYAVKVLNLYGSGSMTAILGGIEWSVDNDMQVINMSIGGIADWPSSVIDALSYAYDSGILIVAGAGNGGNPEGTGDNIWAPARYDSVIAVGATDSSDNRYSSSSTGSTLELMAPGVNIYSTAMGGGYGYISCTSAASPHAAGVAALIASDGIYGSSAIRIVMKESVDDLGDTGWDSQYGWGLIDAYQAMNYSFSDSTAPTTTFSLSGTIGSGGYYTSDVQVTLTATDNEGGAGVAGTRYSLDDGDTWQLYAMPFVISTEGTTNILAKSWDNVGNLESPSVSSEVKIDKTAPVTTISPSGTSGNNGWYLSNVQVTLSAVDNQNGSGVSLVEYSLNNGQTWNTYTAPFTISTEGTNQVLARATDVAGTTETPSVSSEVKIDKTAPVLTEAVDPQQIQRLGKNRWVNVNYTGTAQDSISGVYSPTSTTLIDEYGELSQNLGSNLSGIVAVEAWCDGGDANGRTYTFRLTASDNASNQTYIEAVTVVVK